MKSMKQPCNREASGSNRHGMMTPAIAVALLAVMTCAALVLDRLWIDAAVLELATVAEGAALAAGRELAGDDLLRADADSQKRIEQGKQAAALVARENLVAGDRVEFDLRHDGDVRFGRLVQVAATGKVRFIETAHSPTSVVVTAWRNRERGNPLAMLLHRKGGQQDADVVFRAEATIDNRIAGVRPGDDIAVPALPLAIWKNGAPGCEQESWEPHIEQRAGKDRFAYDPSTGRVSAGSDGLPEIVLRSRSWQSGVNQPQLPNFQLVDLRNDLRCDRLARQILGGWRSKDLSEYGGEIDLAGGPWSLTGSDFVEPECVDAFRQMVGQCRICFLYDEYQPMGNAGLATVRCVELVAGRIMSIRIVDDGSCEIVFQPGIVTTRTAVLAAEVSSNPSAQSREHRYIYKLYLSQ
jgi:hypothetical protein